MEAVAIAVRGNRQMNVWTIEAYNHNDVWSFMTFKGLLGLSWENTAWSRWYFRRANQEFIVLGMNAAMDRELSSVAVDHFLKPATDREMIDLRRLELTPRSSGGLQK